MFIDNNMKFVGTMGLSGKASVEGNVEVGLGAGNSQIVTQL